MGYKGKPDDIIITLLGPTGSGKTNFINTFTGRSEQLAASSLKPDTPDVTPHIITSANPRLVLIDTVGFDDATRPDTEILSIVANWLTQKYANSPALRSIGIIYFHRITDNRMSGSVYKNLQMFCRLCENLPLHRARLVTTMWDKARNLAVAESRESQLRNEFWKKPLDEGAVAKRFDKTQMCAWDIIRELAHLGEGGEVDPRKYLNEMNLHKSANCFSTFLAKRT